MSKRSGKNSPVTSEAATVPKKAQLKKMRRRATKQLEKAQLRLTSAQERYDRVREKGEQAIERARQTSQDFLDKAGAEVEKRVAALARAQSEVQALHPQTPEAVADLLAAKSDESLSTDTPIVSSLNGQLTERESQALRALQSIDSAAGVTSGQWREAAGMSSTTLLRARDRLVASGYVTRSGDSARNTRYRLTETGRTP